MIRAKMIILCLLMLLLATGCKERLQESSGELSVTACHLADCDEVFIDAIEQGEDVLCAFYEVDDERLTRLLLSKHARVIIDEHARHPPSFEARTGEGIMHNKFCVIDSTTVVTGSFNPGSEGTYDNVITISSPPLAQHYEEQFRSLLKGRKPRSRHVRFLHDGMLIEAYACPQDGCRQHLLSTLASAERSVGLLLFTFTDQDVARVLIQRLEAGVEVRGVIESYQSARLNQYSALSARGAPVVLERTPRLQHNKVFVIDGSVVVTGSYNPTRAAATINDENLLIIHDGTVAAHYAALVDDIIKRTQSFK